jgi:hypothetical protein
LYFMYMQVWPVDRGCLLLRGTCSHLWYIRISVFALFSICYFLRDLRCWWLFVIYANIVFHATDFQKPSFTIV